MIATGSLGTIPSREALCLACREKRCCYYYAVAVTARDLWRIARAMQLGPLEFLRYREAPEDGEAGFLLDPAGPLYELVLAKRPRPAPLPSPCVFLVTTNDGQGRCGLGPLRPALCRAYPVYVTDGVVGLINDPAGCVRTWSYAEIDLDEERVKARDHAAEEAEHRDFVRGWNSRVRAGGRARSFEEFCAYLLNRCAAAEAAP